MKQHTTPVIISNGRSYHPDRVSLKTGHYNEQWLQDLCYNHPKLIPVAEIEPAFSGIMPICRELSTPSGFADLVYINDDGFITILECKLWRNPEARRKVVGQILDYAKDLAKWDYDRFEKECLKARKDGSTSLFNLMQENNPDMVEEEFIDNVQSNLSKGRFLLVIVGDGIRENMEDLVDYIQRNGNLNFTLGLVELKVYVNPENKDMIISPRILVKTTEIERIVYRLADEETETESIPKKPEAGGTGISEKVFFERLGRQAGADTAARLRSFTEKLVSEHNILLKPGRGKKMSLSIKTPNDFFNFASVLEDGRVYFYGIVTKTGELGDRNIGISYLKKLAEISGGKYFDGHGEWSWGIRINGKSPQISELLQHEDQWYELIVETMDKMNRIEES
ncbi:MAG: hypothetical protein ACNA8K_14515 [Cyclonatronaceae bacterium]